jgi:hypothetical protein
VGWAAEPAPAPQPSPSDADPLSPYRVKLDTLVDLGIGTTSVPVAFDWRHTKVQIAATGSYLAEPNNFNSMRGGALVRVPSGKLLLEFDATYAASWDSPTSHQLALTPYRQPGHPDHLEVDAVVGMPLAEGVVTAVPRFFPAVQMVFDGYAGFRYLLYPTAFRQLTAKEVALAIVSPSLSTKEIDNLDSARLPAMQVDSARYGVLIGLGDDIYFKSGLFFAPRLMLAIPLLAPVTHTELYVWADFSLAVGVAF